MTGRIFFREESYFHVDFCCCCLSVHMATYLIGFLWVFLCSSRIVLLVLDLSRNPHFFLHITVGVAVADYMDLSACVLRWLCSTMLLWAMCTARRLLLLPYVYATFVTAGMSTAAIVAVLVARQQPHTYESASYVGISCFLLFLDVYSWFCVVAQFNNTAHTTRLGALGIRVHELNEDFHGTNKTDENAQKVTQV